MYRILHSNAQLTRKHVSNSS